MNDPIIILSIVGALVVLMIVLLILKHKINKQLSKHNTPAAQEVTTAQDTTVANEPIIKEEVVVEPQQNVAPQTVEHEEVEDDDDEDDEPAKEKAKSAFIYHISQNKDEKSARYKEWRVRKQGSQKTIKYFLTQKEAIEFAEELAEKNNGKVVIHKKTGEIRKQNYAK